MADYRAADKLPEALLDEACGWVARLRSDGRSAGVKEGIGGKGGEGAREADLREFALWLAASPAHRRAMDAALELWDDLGAVRHLPFAAPALRRQAPPTASTAGDALVSATALSRWKAPQGGSDSRRPAQIAPAARKLAARLPAIPRRRALAGGLALAASIAAAALLMPQAFLSGSGAPTFQTRIGEQLRVELEDGSVVILNTRSRIEVDLSPRRRLVTLLRGEAFFEVAPESRPFTVSAGDAAVTALGTAFGVYLDGEVSRVTVAEGVVRVTELNPPATRPADVEILRENEAVAGGRGGIEQSFATDPAAALAWREGRLVADGMTLRALARELSRYHPRPILLAEPGLAHITVSGVFELDNLSAILLALEHSVAIRSIELPNGAIQLVRAPL